MKGESESLHEKAATVIFDAISTHKLIVVPGQRRLEVINERHRHHRAT